MSVNASKFQSELSLRNTSSEKFTGEAGENESKADFTESTGSSFLTTMDSLTGNGDE